MRVLFICQEFPFSAHNGLTIKTYNLLSTLCESHYCDVLSFSNGNGNGVRELQPHGLSSVQLMAQNSGANLFAKRILSVLRAQPVCSARWTTKELYWWIRERLANRQYDVAYVELVGLASVAPVLGHMPKVLSINDEMVMRLRLRAKYERSKLLRFLCHCNAYLMARHERLFLHQFERVHVVSEREKELVNRVNPKANVAVIPIQIRDDFINKPSVPVSIERPTIVFNGSLAEAHVWLGLKEFLLGAYGRIRQNHPSVQLRVISKSTCRDATDVLRKIEGVEYVDYVKDFVAELDRAALVLVPDLGATGQQNRVIEAMSRERPVLCSATVAQGMPGASWVHYVCCRDTGEYVRAAVRLLQDVATMRSIGAGARGLVKSFFGKADVAKRWTTLLAEAVQDHRDHRSGSLA